MSRNAIASKTKTDIISCVCCVPAGRVTTFDVIATSVGVIPLYVITVLAHLTDDERELLPWHRVVAKGGAIGRGPHRDRQFALLVREGVLVSPAGIVQDMATCAVTNVSPSGLSATKPIDTKPPTAPGTRSRGMKDRPR